MSNGQKKLENAQDFLASWDLGRLDDDHLLMLFHQKNWKYLSKDERLRAMQEVENRRAKADGRPPVEIIVDGSMAPNMYGGYRMLPDGRETIRVNRRFITVGKLFSGADTSIYSGANALSTVLHEGRHAFQYHAVLHGIGNVGNRMQWEWAAFMPLVGGLYNNQNPIIYMLQSVEMDARRFARRQIARISQFFNSLGASDPNFVNQVQRDIEEETLLISVVRAHMTSEMIDQYEEKVLAHFKQTYPNINLKDLKLFDHVRFILAHSEIQDPKEMLERLDRLADQKLGLQDGASLNRFQSLGLNSIKG